MSKHSKKRNKAKKIIAIVLFFVFFSLMCFSGYKIVKWLIENKQSNEIMQNIANTVTIEVEDDTQKQKYNIDFNSLKEKNEEVVAWTKVNGTNIEFPIVQTDDNEYYLTHSLDKSYNSAGWIFMDYKNKLDGKDKNIVVYGHNRRDDSMFGTLKNILNEEWYENIENYVIPFVTQEKNKEYEVFSVYTIEAEDYYTTTKFDSDEEFMEFVRSITERSIKNFNVKVTEKDNILTLSTCADNNKYRVVLHAKEVVE